MKAASRRFADPGKGHIGIRQDGDALAQGRHAPFHRMLCENQILHIVKVRCGVNHPLDHSGVLRRQRNSSLFQFPADNRHAGALNIRREDVFFHQYSTPFLAPIP